MFLWKITYLDCYGCMSIYEEEEYYRAFTPFGAWLRFRIKHWLADENQISGYQDRKNFGFWFMFLGLDIRPVLKRSVEIEK